MTLDPRPGSLFQSQSSATRLGYEPRDELTESRVRVTFLNAGPGERPVAGALRWRLVGPSEAQAGPG